MEEYYDHLMQWMCRTYPNASMAALEHIFALERLLDVCIAAGYSMGASKSKGRLLQHSLEALGEWVGREGLEPCARHVEAISSWPVVDEVGSLRRFLGTFQWIRHHFPKECVIPLAVLTRQLGRNATWPMPAEQVRAFEAIKAMAVRALF